MTPAKLDLESALAAFRASQHNVGHFERLEASGLHETFVPANQAEATAAMLRALEASGAPAGNPKSWRVLDVGCSIGSFAFALAPLVREIVGVDVETEAIDCANAWREHDGVRNASFEAVDASSGLERALDGTFDLVVLKDVTEHLATPASVRRLLASARRLLAPGGAVYLETPNYLLPFEPHLNIYVPPLTPPWALRRIARLRGMAGASDESFFATLLVMSPFTLARSARGAGFAVRDVGATVFLPELMAGKRTAQGGFRLFAPLFRLLGKGLLGRAVTRLASALHAYPTVAFVLSR